MSSFAARAGAGARRAPVDTSWCKRHKGALLLLVSPDDCNKFKVCKPQKPSRSENILGCITFEVPSKISQRARQFATEVIPPEVQEAAKRDRRHSNFGFYPPGFYFLQDHASLLHELGVAVVSVVEGPTGDPKFPNTDVLGFAGHGSVDPRTDFAPFDVVVREPEGDDYIDNRVAAAAAIREAKEEGGIHIIAGDGSFKGTVSAVLAASTKGPLEVTKTGHDGAAVTVIPLVVPTGCVVADPTTGCVTIRLPGRV